MNGMLLILEFNLISQNDVKLGTVKIICNYNYVIAPYHIYYLIHFKQNIFIITALDRTKHGEHNC